MKNSKVKLSTVEIKSLRKKELDGYTVYIHAEIAKFARRARKRKNAKKEVVLPREACKFLADCGYKWGEYCTLTDSVIFTKLLKARAELRKALEKCKTHEDFINVRNAYTLKAKESYTIARADGAIKRVTVAIARNSK